MFVLLFTRLALQGIVCYTFRISQCLCPKGALLSLRSKLRGGDCERTVLCIFCRLNRYLSCVLVHPVRFPSDPVCRKSRDRTDKGQSRNVSALIHTQMITIPSQQTNMRGAGVLNCRSRRNQKIHLGVIDDNLSCHLHKLFSHKRHIALIGKDLVMLTCGFSKPSQIKGDLRMGGSQ